MLAIHSYELQHWLLILISSSVFNTTHHSAAVYSAYCLWVWERSPSKVCKQVVLWHCFLLKSGSDGGARDHSHVKFCHHPAVLAFYLKQASCHLTRRYSEIISCGHQKICKEQTAFQVFQITPKIWSLFYLTFLNVHRWDVWAYGLPSIPS